MAAETAATEKMEREKQADYVWTCSDTAIEGVFILSVTLLYLPNLPIMRQ